MFELLSTDQPRNLARRGRLTTAHGVIETPAFMPVGTQGTVKAVSPAELRDLRAQVILGNTYHLFVRPGLDVMRAFGGLHAFMRWDGPILTDSGGYQVFSLAKIRKITEEGVHFQNHLDGTPTFIGPETAMEIQSVLGSDINMAFDECPPYPCEHDYAAKSLDLTLRWARRCRDWAAAHPTSETTGLPQLRFGIVQGATFADLREKAARALARWIGTATRSAACPWASRRTEMMLAVERANRSCPPTGRATRWAWARRRRWSKWSRAAWTCSTACCRHASPATARRSRRRARSICATASTSATRGPSKKAANARRAGNSAGVICGICSRRRKSSGCGWCRCTTCIFICI